MSFRSNYIIGMAFLLMTGCQTNNEQSQQKSNHEEGHVSWSLKGNIYEVNIRQYTPEGTFQAFEAHLQRLRDMGVETLWFMPIHPISKTDRKGELGSYYAISSYYAVNPEFGTLDEWKHLVSKAKEMGFQVLMDWVPNHTGADHEWLSSHPEFYVLDTVKGQPLAPFDWTDVRELNYDNAEMRDSMVAALSYWLKTTPIDGFRVDVAWGVPFDFWKTCIPALKKIRPGLFMLAEAEGPEFHEAGFDATYPWSVFHTLNKIASGDRNVYSLDSVLAAEDSTYPSNALRMYFTSNHDENSWNKADYGTMPGPIHAPFSVFTQTYQRSIPLIYSGQEEPVMDSIRFFYKDTIPFQKKARESFYHTLLKLRKTHPALKASIPSKRMSLGDPAALFSYLKESENQKILIVLNFSKVTQEAVINGIGEGRKATNIFNKQETVTDEKKVSLEPWGYKVYSTN